MNPQRAWLQLTLLDEVVVSADAATAGGHRGLGYIPGATLLGVAASRLYAAWERDRARAGWAWRAFQGGAVRFGDAVPLLESGPVFAAPLSLHGYKKPEGTPDGPRHLLNLARRARVENDQLVQLRGLGLGRQTLVQPPRRRQRLRTAISATTGRADEGRLFGYEALEPRQIFVALLEADAAASEPFAEILASFRRDGTIAIGRSRATEYGRVEVKVLEASTYALPEARATAQAVTLVWALSDLALTDLYGQPTLRPEPAAFGFAGGHFVEEKSFLRSRAYWPWNAALGAREAQRVVVVAGSVLAFRPGSGQAPASGVRRVGQFQAQGLGLVVISPSLLEATDPRLGTADSPTMLAPNPDLDIAPDAALAAWLDRRADTGERLAADAEALRRQVEALYRSAARLRGREEGVTSLLEASGGPAPNQWGEVQRRAEREGDGAMLRAALFQGQHAIAALGDVAWSERWVVVKNDGTTGTFRAWLEGVVNQHGETVEGRKIIARMAREVAAMLKRDRETRRRTA
ncbi:hypothetical protein [Falsiroseomonas sp.]|uniref:hypothetical protein n=1 Tax=Falsiroseomonas sp. TaxID=2870721 RepID=UPI003F727090